MKSIMKCASYLRNQFSRLGQLIPPQYLVNWHFILFSKLTHPNRAAFKIALSYFDFKSIRIIETGTSAWGTDSTRLWDSYIKRVGGEVWSVDIREEAGNKISKYLSDKTHLIVADSVEFLNSRVYKDGDLYFLDSWDVDWSSPQASALHGLREFLAISDILKPGNLVLIDDTPARIDFIPEKFHNSIRNLMLDESGIPGKGQLVLKKIRNDPRFEIIYHDYALLFCVKY
jgi:hypothetical protein